MPDRTAPRPRGRRLVALAAVFAILASLCVAWSLSRLPASYAMTDLGHHDYGGGPAPAGQGGHGDGHGPGSVGVDTLVTRADGRTPDVRVELVARREPVTLADGRRLDGYSLNGRTPGPTIEATQGDLVEVRLVNDNVTDGTTLHWHGVDVPNAEDGGAGVTQDAVPPGGSHTYRFVADQVGTYWYHSHQQSHPQVVGGLLGAIVVRPASGLGDVLDVTALVHHYGGVKTINGSAGESRVDAAPGQVVRVRVINTDDATMPVWVAGASFRLVAVDGTDVLAPTAVTDRSVQVTAGARADLEVVVPGGRAAGGGAVRVQVAGASLVVGRGAAPTASAPREPVDLLTYGAPVTPEPGAALPFAAADADRTFDYEIGRAFGLLDGRPGAWWTINGHLYPDVPMFMVAEGDRVVMRITNHSGEPHPMHLHGLLVNVLARNGTPASGSRWVVDSLDVADGDTFEVAFVADNPGIWMDHCHTLPHASEGLVTHLGYIGYSTPYRVGEPHGNHPE